MMSAGQFLVLLFSAMMLIMAKGAPSLQQRCAQELTGMATCLDFATGKEANPTSQCCKIVSDGKTKDPACLCYIIQQIHKGTTPELKQMGLQESRLLQLPSACKLTNASISDCPKLLDIPPNSPDYAFFTNSSASAAAAGPTPPSIPGGMASGGSNGSNNGFKSEPLLAGTIAIAVATFIWAFPTEQLLQL